jgi:hypothetical protein
VSARVTLPATLTREMPVRIIDMSASGCLIESWCRIEIGTIGTLQLRIGGEEYRDDVEIVRCDAVEGLPALFRVGARLLWTTPRRGSIRQAAEGLVVAWFDPARVM